MTAWLTKILSTSIIILALRLIKRRWGEIVSGWVVALPLTSGPISYFIAREQGESFAAGLASGAITGTAAQACFCMCYSAVSRQWKGRIAFCLAVAAFFISGTLLRLYAFSMVPTLGIVLIASASALSIGAENKTSAAKPRSRWDLPVHLLLANSMMIGLTAIAPALGPGMSGLLATFPVFATVLMFAAYQNSGAAASRQVVHGMLLGLLGVAGFFFVLKISLSHMALNLAFLNATIAALVIQGIMLAIRPVFLKRFIFHPR